MDMVKYDNGVNKLRLGTLTEKETDLFFSLMFKYKDEGKRKLILSFEELKELSEQQRTDRLIDDLYRLLDDKLLKITIAGTGVDEKKGRYGERANIFSYYKLFEEAGELHINITEEFQAKLTGLLGNFTIFDLKELVSLKGSYPKTLFRLLKQWETTKEYIVFISEFRDLLGIPATYRQCDIDTRILNPCLEELKQFFPNLKVEKVKKGVKIDKLIFTWKAKVKPVKNLGSAVKIKQGLTDEEISNH